MLTIPIIRPTLEFLDNNLHINAKKYDVFYSVQDSEENDLQDSNNTQLYVRR